MDDDRNVMREKHYTAQELADMWNLAVSVVREWFRDEPGVLKQGAPDARRGKRSYEVMRISESIAWKVYREKTQGYEEKRRADAERKPPKKQASSRNRRGPRGAVDRDDPGEIKDTRCAV